MVRHAKKKKKRNESYIPGIFMIKTLQLWLFKMFFHYIFSLTARTNSVTVNSWGAKWTFFPQRTWPAGTVVLEHIHRAGTPVTSTWSYQDEFFIGLAEMSCFFVNNGISVSKNCSEFPHRWINTLKTFGKNPVFFSAFSMNSTISKGSSFLQETE